MPRPQWPAATLAVVLFFWLGFATNPLHDYLFLSHTSIQDGVEVCRQDDCWTEDHVRAYTSHGWALFGNSVALAFLAARAFVSLLAYVTLKQVGESRNLSAIILIPAGMTVASLATLPYEFYSATRITVFICCGFLSITAWRTGARLVPLPLATLAVLFNPIIRFDLPPSTWRFVDASAAVSLLVLAGLSWFASRQHDGVTESASTDTL
jgi:hypothetical protein